jgi:hypothetical protein
MHRFRSIVAGAGVIVAGCFGEGPTPADPVGAQILFHAKKDPAQSDCDSMYIGAVAFGDGPDGFAVTLPYALQNMSNCSAPTRRTIVVQSFGKNGDAGHFPRAGDPEPRAGNSDGGTVWPLLAAAGDGPTWAFVNETVQPREGRVEPGEVPIVDTNNRISPAGLHADATATYLAVTVDNGSVGQTVNHPQYPCCGNFPVQQRPPGRITRIQGTSVIDLTIDRTPWLWTETSADTLVGNSTSLVYLDHADTLDDTEVRIIPKAGGPAVNLDVSIEAPMVPVGLAADDAHVAIAVSRDYRNTDPSTKLCAIRLHDLVQGPQPKTLLNTSAFSCMGAALDTTHVYFAIVSVGDDRQDMRGIGIGRIQISDRTFEGLELGIEGRSAGPRRIYLDGESMYVVDPYVIAKISKHALDGRRDFELP